MPQKLKVEGHSAGLPQPNTFNQHPQSIQQSANQLMNTPFLQPTDSLTSGRYALSPETVRRRMSCSTFLLWRLPRHLLVPTPLSAIPFVSTLYQQFEVLLPIYHLKPQVSNRLQISCSWISLGICKWKVLRLCYSTFVCFPPQCWHMATCQYLLLPYSLPYFIVLLISCATLL
jgi:hypothetical protein